MTRSSACLACGVRFCACGAPIEPVQGKGRPRLRCRRCAADKSALAKAWRADHPDEVVALNASKREAYAADRLAILARRRAEYRASHPFRPITLGKRAA